MRMWSLAVAVVATGCAHAGRPISPALAGAYRFSDAIPGLGIVSGGFEVDVTGQVTKFSGTVLANQRTGSWRHECRLPHPAPEDRRPRRLRSAGGQRHGAGQ